MVDFKGTINYAQTIAQSLAGTALTVEDASVFDGDNALPNKQLRLSVIRDNVLIAIVTALSRSGNVITLEETADIDPDDIIKATITSEAFEDIHNSINALFASQSFNYSTQLVSGGGVAWVTGYQYRVSAASYYINGILYSSTEQSITLDTADVTNDRFDVIGLNTSGTVIKVTGTPAPNPSVPDIDPATQLSLTFVAVEASSTEPVISGIVNIYLEDTEWTSSVSGGITKNSTNNPQQGTKCVEATNAAANAYFQFQNATTIDVSEKNTLVFYLRSKGNWGNKTLNIRFQSNGVTVGSAVSLGNNLYGFTSTNTTSYQQIVIPISRFAIPAGYTVNQLRFTVIGGGSNIGFYFDNCTLQVDVINQTLSNLLTQSEADARYLESAQNLSDLSNAATARASLGLVIGTNVLAPNGSGASLTSLNASNISSGTLNAARLPTLTNKRTLVFILASGADATTAMVTANPIKVKDAHTLLAAWAQCGTAPTGANLIVSIEKSTNLSSWTDLWAGSTSNRPTITATNKSSSDVTSFDTTSGSAGTFYRAKVIQIGSTIAGKDITLELELSY